MSLRIFSDYHMHPQGHRLQTYSQALLQPWADHCRRKGITDFALTDHDRYHEGINFAQIETFRERNPDLKIRAGIELDNDPVHSEKGHAWVEKNWERLDFVLGSVHFLDQWAFDHAGQEEEFKRRNVDEVYENYIRELLLLISRGHIDCLSHLDLVKIFGFKPSAPLEKLFLPVLEAIKAADLSLEINTAGWRKPVGIQYPEKSILEEVMKLKIPLTFSSDAHSYVQTGEDYPKLMVLLKELGVNEVAIYHRHRRTMHSLTSWQTFSSSPTV